MTGCYYIKIRRPPPRRPKTLRHNRLSDRKANTLQREMSQSHNPTRQKFPQAILIFKYLTKSAAILAKTEVPPGTGPSRSFSTMISHIGSSYEQRKQLIAKGLTITSGGCPHSTTACPVRAAQAVRLLAEHRRLRSEAGRVGAGEAADSPAPPCFQRLLTSREK